MKTSIVIKSCPWRLLLNWLTTSSKLYRDHRFNTVSLFSCSIVSQHNYLKPPPSVGPGQARSRFSSWGLWLAALLAGVIILGGWAGLEAGAIAAPLCRSVSGHQICILSIQRSAKYFWQYRTVLSIDGETQPDTTYDCRQRQHIAHDGRITAFSPRGTGSWICRFFKQP